MTTKTISVANRIRLTAIGAFLLFAIAGCGKEAPPIAPKTEAAAQDIPLNIGTLKIASLSNLYAADKLGYFKEEGLKVNFTQMDGGSQLLTSISAGKIDIALSTPSSPIQAIDKGFDFRMIMQNEIAAKEGQDTQALFVNADSGIGSLKDLKGKTIATSTIRNQMWLSLSKVLKQNGVDQTQVNYVELPLPNMEDSLRNKQVDAVFNVEPFTSRMLSNPKFKVISYPATEALPGQPLGAFWASNKWLASNGNAAQKFVNAMNKANGYLSAHPDETMKIIAEYTGIKLEAIQKMHPVLWNSKVDRNTLQSLLDLMHSYGMTKADLKVDAIVYPTAMQ
jgi:NitT/TauT family transport system substrate-binding protein